MTYIFDKNQLQQKIEEKGAVLPCHRCGHNSFAIMPGVSRIQLDDSFDPGTFSIGGGKQMPVAYIVCNNCSAITMHAIGGLGLVNFTKNDEKD